MTHDSLAHLSGKPIAHVDRELRDLIPDFLANRWQDTRTIMEGLELRDYQTIRNLGHDLKGVGGAYGFDAIGDIGHSLEQAAMDENQAEIRKQVQELTTYLEQVEIVYE